MKLLILTFLLFSCSHSKITKNDTYIISKSQDEFLHSRPNHVTFFNMIRKGATSEEIAKKHSLSRETVLKYEKDLIKINMLKREKGKLKVAFSEPYWSIPEYTKTSKANYERSLREFTKENISRVQKGLDLSLNHNYGIYLSEAESKKLVGELRKVFDSYYKNTVQDKNKDGINRYFFYLIGLKNWDPSLFTKFKKEK